MKNLPFSTAVRAGLLLGLLLAGRSGRLLAQPATPAEGPLLMQPGVLGLLVVLLVVVGAAIVLASRVAPRVRRQQTRKGRFGREPGTRPAGSSVSGLRQIGRPPVAQRNQSRKPVSCSSFLNPPQPTRTHEL